uniref:Uncharacterized protein n=1 Tax=Leersia perrieri TaxID=77586 RepID=A0A0D9W217_9ORYZ
MDFGSDKPESAFLDCWIGVCTGAAIDYAGSTIGFTGVEDDPTSTICLLHGLGRPILPMQDAVKQTQSKPIYEQHARSSPLARASGLLAASEPRRRWELPVLELCRFHAAAKSSQPWSRACSPLSLGAPSPEAALVPRHRQELPALEPSRFPVDTGISLPPHRPGPVPPLEAPCVLAAPDPSWPRGAVTGGEAEG